MTQRFCLLYALSILPAACIGNQSLNIPQHGTEHSRDLPGGDNGLPRQDPDPSPFTPGTKFTMEPVGVESYVSKVKTLLTSLPASDAEIALVRANPNALGQLISAWQTLPAYRVKMLQFLAVAFQQTQTDVASFVDQSATLHLLDKPELLLANLHESFARTVLYNDEQSKPFTEAMTTQTFMMTPPLALLYIFLDKTVVDDAGQIISYPESFLKPLIERFGPDDYKIWKPIRVRRPTAGEVTTSLFADPAQLTELVLNVPRYGFFSTPSFLAGCPTNRNNAARVTINQTMITALGQAFKGSNSIMPQSLAALDGQHAAPNTPCYACHLSLDPMRQFFRQAYSIYYSAQFDDAQQTLPGMFAFDGVSVSGSGGIYDLGLALSRHPSLSAAWVQKLCTWANDAPCLTTDPEFARLTQLFSQDFSWSGLVRELFSSNLVTHRQSTEVSRMLDSFSVTKRDHLCPLLSTRLQIDDLCGLDPTTTVTGDLLTVRTVAQILPAHGYIRGAEMPILANDSTLFFRSALESMCVATAKVAVEGSMSRFQTDNPNLAIKKLVYGLMGMPTGPSAQQAVPILQQHFDDAVRAGNTAQDALRSTFVVACLSPAVAGMGQ